MNHCVVRGRAERNPLRQSPRTPSIQIEQATRQSVGSTPIGQVPIPTRRRLQVSSLAQASLRSAGTEVETARARPLSAAGVFQRSEADCAPHGLSVVYTVARRRGLLGCNGSQNLQQLQTPCTVSTAAASTAATLEITLRLCSGPPPVDGFHELTNQRSAEESGLVRRQVLRTGEPPASVICYAHPRMATDGTRRQFLGGIATASALAALPAGMDARRRRGVLAECSQAIRVPRGARTDECGESMPLAEACRGHGH